MPEPIYLCVMSDDLGMHPAVNDGIAQSFCDGLLTDANIMAPCPAFRDAAAIARQIGLPVGFHATLTCDWDRFFWGPLTQAPSLVTEQGNFKHLVSLAWGGAKDEEVLAELIAQVEACEAEGLKMTHSSNHMGSDGTGRLMRMFGQIGFNRVGPVRVARHQSLKPGDRVEIQAYQWDTQFFSTDWSLDYTERKARLLSNIRAMQPGYHLWMVHAAIDTPALDDICSPDFFARDWARPFRALDQQLLLDPEVKDTIEECEITRIPVTQAPVKVVLANGPGEE